MRMDFCSQRCSIFFLAFFSALIYSFSYSTSTSINETFIQCLSNNSPPSSPITNVVYSPSNSSYSSILESTSKNLRFLTSTTPKPLFIITPLIDSHVQATVICCRKYGLQVRTRSGGHDFEGLSVTSDFPSFIVLDLVKMKAVDIDMNDSTAWVQNGANNGDVYYAIAKKSNTLGFPAGTYPTVGFGGLVSGGGLGLLLRKYGVAAESVLDARIVDANGKILDKASMGEDLFWAIRGGGGASFGVILAWKIKLVPVTPIVTVFTVPKTLEQGGSELLNKWQYIAPKMTNDVFFRIMIRNVPAATKGNRTVEIQFRVFFLGRAEQLLQVMQAAFPELGVQRKDCIEMTFVESIVYFSNYREQVPIEALVNLSPDPKTFLKAKSDYVREPISEAGLQGLWKRCIANENIFLVMDAYGGKMNEVSESELPFPHRAGNLFSVMYFVYWTDVKETNRHMEWSRSTYNYMAPHVSKSPRATYVNTRDLDLGRNMFGRRTTYSQAMVWGNKCFKGNFRRLALVKGKVDPSNFFMNEQSIPPLVTRG